MILSPFISALNITCTLYLLRKKNCILDYHRFLNVKSYFDPAALISPSCFLC